MQGQQKSQEEGAALKGQPQDRTDLGKRHLMTVSHDVFSSVYWGAIFSSPPCIPRYLGTLHLHMSYAMLLVALAVSSLGLICVSFDYIVNIGKSFQALQRKDTPDHWSQDKAVKSRNSCQSRQRNVVLDCLNPTKSREARRKQNKTKQNKTELSRRLFFLSVITASKQGPENECLRVRRPFLRQRKEKKVFCICRKQKKRNDQRMRTCSPR